ncbi:hypothetical protein GCM10020331_053290 [Ectobacillus funiculus]
MLAAVEICVKKEMSMGALPMLISFYTVRKDKFSAGSEFDIVGSF